MGSRGGAPEATQGAWWTARSRARRGGGISAKMHRQAERKQLGGVLSRWRMRTPMLAQSRCGGRAGRLADGAKQGEVRRRVHREDAPTSHTDAADGAPSRVQDARW